VIPDAEEGLTMTEQTLSEIGRSVSVGGLVTNVLDAGSGPAVLLLHGSGPGVSAYANWRLTIPALAAQFRVIAFDQPGFGYTERPAGAVYSAAGWTDHVLGVMDALEMERVALVGNSFGGAIALRFAVEHPERVSRLVLMGSVGVPFPITPALDKVWGFTSSVDGMRDLMEVFAFDRSLLSTNLAKLRHEAATRPGVQEAYTSMFPEPRQRWVDSLVVPDSDLAALHHDTLVVHGRDDEVIPLGNSLRLHQLIDNSQLHVFGRCGHWVQIEQTERFNALVTGFLREGA
jgi:2-hydroxymuconate-semialdehyde hydrolase